MKMNRYKYRVSVITFICILIIFGVFVWSIFVGQYPLSVDKLLAGDSMQVRVFSRLRLPRAIMGIVGGFGLGVAGNVYQMVFKNPLASPDVVGVKMNRYKYRVDRKSVV